MKRCIALLLVVLLLLPMQAMAKSYKMEADVPVWTEETVRQYILDYVDGGHMDVLYSYYDLQIRRYMPEFTYEKLLTELAWLTGEFVALGDYTCFEEAERKTKTHVVHMHMEKQDLDVYFTHKNLEDDWEIMAFEFIPAEKQEVDVGFAVGEQPSSATLYEESQLTLNAGTDVELAAILTLPAGLEAGQEVPGCVLVHDEGPLDLNASVGATRFFEHLAHELADMGVASIRYDKRTYTYGETADMTVYDEVVADAVAAANLLAENEHISSDAITIVGHGFGGYVAPYIANEAAGLVDGLVLIGSRPERYAVQLLNRADLSQMSQEEADSLNVLVASLIDMSKEEAAAVELFGHNGAYFWELQQNAPISLIMRLLVPTYIVQGRNDATVTENEGWRTWNEELKNYGEYLSYQSYRGLNHMLANDLSVDENGVPQYAIDAGVDVTAARDLALWMQQLMPTVATEVAQ